MGADNVGGCLLQRVEVERKPAGPDVRGEHRGADDVAGKDAVLVCFSQGAVAGVEVFGHGFDGEDTDAGGKGSVERAMQVGHGDGDGESEGGNLGEGVNAGVSAARALGEYGFAGDAMDGLRESALYGGDVGLDLPTVVWGSVVGEDDLPVRHEDDRDGITTECLRRICRTAQI